MVFMLDSVIEVHTFLTKDVLPMRLGDIRIVFTPFSKLDLILLVSCVPDSFGLLCSVGKIVTFYRYSKYECFFHKSLFCRQM